MVFGVIGANGVAATNRLCEMIERKLTLLGAFRDAHHPEMIVVQATQVPSRSMYLEGRGESFVPEYVRIARMLKEQGCDKVCMCCNTAHYAIDEISAASGASFINLLDIVAKRVAATGIRRVELWVSDGARKFDIYGKAFREYAPDTEVVYPSEERQANVTKVICAVKTSARFLSEADEGNPRVVIRKLLRGAAAPVIFGCTDVRIAYKVDDALDAGIVLDSLECLSDEIVLQFMADCARSKREGVMSHV